MFGYVHGIKKKEVYSTPTTSIDISYILIVASGYHKLIPGIVERYSLALDKNDGTGIIHYNNDPCNQTQKISYAIIADGRKTTLIV